MLRERYHFGTKPNAFPSRIPSRFFPLYRFCTEVQVEKLVWVVVLICGRSKMKTNRQLGANVSKTGIRSSYPSDTRLQISNRKIQLLESSLSHCKRAIGLRSNRKLLRSWDSGLTFSGNRVELRIVCCPSSWPGSTCSLTIG